MDELPSMLCADCTRCWKICISDRLLVMGNVTAGCLFQTGLACRMYRVVVLQAGYSVVQADGSMRANGTSTLVVGGEHRVVVDTLSPWDRWEGRPGSEGWQTVFKCLADFHNVAVDPRWLAFSLRRLKTS